MDSVESLLAFNPAAESWDKDCIEEVAHVCECSPARAAELVEKLTAFDALVKKRTMSILDYYAGAGIPNELVYIIQTITQPMRAPGAGRLQANRAVCQWLTSEKVPLDDRTLLDYGGGGGRDSILFSRLGLQVTLAELPSYLTTISEGPMIRRRMEGRGLEVEFVPLGCIRPAAYHFANCIDVLEHCYDVEFALCSVTHQLKQDGILFVWGDFDNVTYNGDHIEKNRFYARSGVWPRLMEALGYTLVAARPSGSHMEIWRQTRESRSLEDLLLTAYETSQAVSEEVLSDALREGFRYTLGVYRHRDPSTLVSRYVPRLERISDAFYTREFCQRRVRNLKAGRSAG